VATFVYCPLVEGPERMALRFGRSRRFEDVRLSTFALLDERLGAKAELGDIARTMVERVNAEWPRAAALLEAYPEHCRRIERFVKERAVQLA
jgi:serine/threonine-protein kinase HipA